MNIQDVKVLIGQQAGFDFKYMHLSRQMDKDSTPENPIPTEWLTHWDNDHRVRVVMHEDVMSRIKADPSFSGLLVKPMEEVTPVDETGNPKPSYKKFVVITPNIEATF